MVNYRRLISYIYAYEGSVKGKNIGFAKLEARNGQCRLNINVKKVYSGGGDLGVYLLAPDKEMFLGNIFIHNGAGEFRAVIPLENIGESDCTMEACYGLSIHEKEEDWRVYKTIWEDGVTQAAEVDLAEVTSQRVGDESEQIQRKLTELNQEIQAEEERLEEEREKMVQETVGCPEPVISEPEQGQPSGEEPPLLGDPQELVRLEQEERTDCPELLWETFRRRYPKIQAFDSPGSIEILTIRPQDIGLLPRENWNYGNNSFLLHGYYNYRYLVFARVGDEARNRVRYILGVPGHYYSNEKYMASMFGFPHFVLAKKQPVQNGRFGYWYVDISMENTD